MSLCLCLIHLRESVPELVFDWPEGVIGLMFDQRERVLLSLLYQAERGVSDLVLDQLTRGGVP